MEAGTPTRSNDTPHDDTGSPPSIWGPHKLLWDQCTWPSHHHPMPGTPPPLDPQLGVASLQLTGTWGQTEQRIKGTRDSTHGCPDLSYPSSPVLGAKPGPPHTSYPQQPPRGAPSAPRGHGAPRGVHLPQHPRHGALGAHPQARWVWGAEGTRGGRQGAHGSVAAPSQSCSRCTALPCPRAAPAPPPAAREGSGGRSWGWRQDGLSGGDPTVTPAPPWGPGRTRGGCHSAAPPERGEAACRWPPVSPGRQ